MSYLIMQELKLKKGSSLTGSEFIGKLSIAQAKKIAEVMVSTYATQLVHLLNELYTI